MNRIHTITADWLFTKLKYSGEPRMIIKDNRLLTWGKDQWGDEKPKRYKFVRYCKEKYAFQIKCLGKNCGWSELFPQKEGKDER